MGSVGGNEARGDGEKNDNMATDGGRWIKVGGIYSLKAAIVNQSMSHKHMFGMLLCLFPP